MTDTLPRARHWTGVEVECAVCHKPIRFGDRYSNTDEPALCHEPCGFERAGAKRPIIMESESVRETLAGRKVQTRRAIKPQPWRVESTWQWGRKAYMPEEELWKHDHAVWGDGVTPIGMVQFCPYGCAGDHLWVRETWSFYDWHEDGWPFIQYRADKEVLLRRHPESWCDRVNAIWAQLSEPKNFDVDNRAGDRRWRAPIYMPCWASRLTLKIANVRVERLHDVGWKDIIAEGCDPQASQPRLWYANRWDQLNPRYSWDTRYSWDANPWVWVLEYNATEGNDEVHG